MKILATVALAVLLMTQPCIAEDFCQTDYVTYIGHTGDPLSIEWDAVSDVTDYEVEFRHFERNYVIFRGYTSDTSMSYLPPRTGHYSVYVRSRRLIDVNIMSSVEEELLRQWVSSVKNDRNFTKINPTTATKAEMIAAIEKQKHVYSDASASTNNINATVNGIPKPWWVYAYTAPPGGITF